MQDIILPASQHGAQIILKADLTVQVHGLIERLQQLPAITDQASMDAVRAVMVESSKLASTLDAQRLNAKAPWAAIGAQIDDAVRPWVDAVKQIKEEAKAQITAWVIEQDRLKAEAARAAAVAQAAAAAAVQAMQAPPAGFPPGAGWKPAAAPQLQVTALPTEVVAPTSTRTELDVYDEANIPRQYFDLNRTRLEEALKSGIQVAGARLKTVVRVVAR